MKKFLFIFILLSLFFVIGGAALALLLNKVNAPDSNTNTVSDISKPTGTTVPQKRKATLKITKSDNKYQVAIYNDNLDINSFQLKIVTSGQFSSFEKNPIFDVQLVNNIASDGIISLSLGKLENRDKLNLLRTQDGGFIIGYLILNPNAKSGEVKNYPDAEENIIVDSESDRYIEEFSFQIP